MSVGVATQIGCRCVSVRSDKEESMPVAHSFSLKQARRLALAAQGFGGRRPPASIKAARLNQQIERLGLLQIDSVNALVRAHYLPLFSRLGSYPQQLLDQAAWSQGRQRTLFEYWGHEASLLPMSMYPLMRWRMQRSPSGPGYLFPAGAVRPGAAGHDQPGTGGSADAGRPGRWQPVQSRGAGRALVGLER